MKNTSKVIALAIALVVVLSAFVVIATDKPVSGGQANTGNDDSDNVIPDVPALTTIEATTSAVGYWENTTSYQWTLDKEYQQDDVLAQANENGAIPSLQIRPGETALMSFDITATRGNATVSEDYGVRGAVTVTNTGGNATDDLAISVTVQGFADGTWVDLATVQVNTAGTPVLGAGDSHDYAYGAVFDPSGYAEFRVIANVTITNFVDHSGEAYGASACASFELPSEITNVVLNEEAYLTDCFSLPEGFTYEVVSNDGPWTLSGDGPWTFYVQYNVTNVNAPSGTTYVLNNQAKLSLNDTGDCIVANAQVKVYADDHQTSLSIGTSSNTYWTEYTEFGLDFNADDVSNLVNLTGEQPLNASTPVNVTSLLVVDDNNFVVSGTITLTNTGYYATEGLALTYAVQMWNGAQWVNVASVNVDVSDHPVLGACESYTYNFTISFCIDGVGLGPFGYIHNVTLASVVHASIANLDDGVSPCSLVDFSPLYVPLKQNVLTVVTKANFVNEDIVPMPEAGYGNWMKFDNQVCYEQRIVVTNCDDQTTVETCTEIRAVTVVTYHCYLLDDVSRTLYNNYAHSESALITGDSREVTLGDGSAGWDNDTMEVCALSSPVDVNLSALLVYGEVFHLAIADGIYVLQNALGLYYGVSASMQLPAILIAGLD